MGAEVQAKNSPITVPAMTPAPANLLQRKCACGGDSGVSGECEDCRRKMLIGNVGGLQAKLVVNQPGDIWELEADRIAESVIAGHPFTSGALQGLHHRPAVMRQAGCSPSASMAPASVVYVVGSTGYPLDPDTRAFMEPRFGYDFSDVRIHNDDTASKSSQEVNALAYTVGQHIVFRFGQYNPHTSEGKRLLAHELMHTVQQSQGLVHQEQIVQRWFSGDHKELTEEGINSVIPTLDDQSKSDLIDNSNDLDIGADTFFNVRGALKHGIFLLGASISTLAPSTWSQIVVTAGIPSRPPINPDAYHDALVELYQNNREQALNHGEGGLYSMSKNDAIPINIDHQNLYINRARLLDMGIDNVLQQFGNALHVAQDRGAHGEGGKGYGHDLLIDLRNPNELFNPDNPTINSDGYTEAQINTNKILEENKNFLLEVCGSHFETITMLKESVDLLIAVSSESTQGEPIQNVSEEGIEVDPTNPYWMAYILGRMLTSAERILIGMNPWDIYFDEVHSLYWNIATLKQEIDSYVEEATTPEQIQRSLSLAQEMNRINEIVEERNLEEETYLPEETPQPPFSSEHNIAFCEESMVTLDAIEAILNNGQWLLGIIVVGEFIAAFENPRGVLAVFELPDIVGALAAIPIIYRQQIYNLISGLLIFSENSMNTDERAYWEQMLSAFSD